jgi:hypothetical protein
MRLETARGESLATARLWTKAVARSRGPITTAGAGEVGKGRQFAVC